MVGSQTQTQLCLTTYHFFKFHTHTHTHNGDDAIPRIKDTLHGDQYNF